MKPYLFILGLPLFLLTSALLLKYSLSIPSTPSVLSAQDELVNSDIPYSLSYSVESGDARPIIIRDYLHLHQSSLEPLATQIIEISDKYELDYRLLVAIARQESNLCKKIPDNSYNCWGYGIYGDKVIRFDNYSQGLETVAKTLKTKYVDQGLITPEQIMAKYTPPSLEKGGPWAKGINQFLAEME